jgi:hypothetical protein
VHIVSVQFVEGFALRQAPGPATRIDLTGVMFSMAAPSPVPVTIDPHLFALIWCPEGQNGNGVFEVSYRRTVDGEEVEIARNVSPFQVEPGKFTYRLVKAELTFDSYGPVVAHSRVDRGDWHVVPFTLLPPAA